MNAMILFRPHPGDIRDWQSRGHFPYSWEESLVYLQRAEEMMGLRLVDTQAYPSESLFVHPMTAHFLKACEEYGMEIFQPGTSVDPGAKVFTRNIKNGFRYSVADAYLRTNVCSSYVDLRSHCLVEKILVDQKKAFGLEYRQHSQKHMAIAGKEILLCAGSIQSPQILQLSGVGDPEVLDPCGIPVLHAVPELGRNLKDHLVCGMAFRLKRGLQSLDGLRLPGPALRAALQFIFTRTGPLTSNIAEAGAFCGDHIGRPELQFHFGPAFFVDHGFTKIRPYGISFGPALLHPGSHGSVRLASANPADSPIIEPNYFQDSSDLTAMLEGLKLTRDLSAMPSLAKLIDDVEYPESMPVTDEVFIRHIRQYSETLYHPVSTCRMGSDPNAVVDLNFKLKGIEGLRICDASVFPDQTSSNPQLTIMMLAEMLSSILTNE